MEVKGDRQGGRRGTYFLELVSNAEKDTPGCFLYSRADLLAYVFLDRRELHLLPLPAAREWFVARASEFPLRQARTRIGPAQYTTVGATVPARRLLAEVRGARRVELTPARSGGDRERPPGRARQLPAVINPPLQGRALRRTVLDEAPRPARSPRSRRLLLESRDRRMGKLRPALLRSAGRGRVPGGLSAPVPGCTAPAAATGVLDLAALGWAPQGGVLVVPAVRARNRAAGRLRVPWRGRDAERTSAPDSGSTTPSTAGPSSSTPTPSRARGTSPRCLPMGAAWTG